MAKIKQVDVTDVIQDGMMEYSAYVLLNRVIPDVRDGMKPAHRRILYTMKRDNITKLTKSGPVAAEVMKIHPHGDMNYDTMVGMVQTDKNIHPYIEGKGNFGLYVSNSFPAASSRYTEVKLTPFSKILLEDLPKRTVPFVDNYDSTQKIPTVLPTRFPSVLITPQQGIGVGMSAKLPSFCLEDVAKITIQHLQGKKMDYIYPDFTPSGYIVYNSDVEKTINTTGTGSVVMRGKAEIVGKTIRITEIPYGTTIERIMDKIIELAQTPKMDEVTDVKNLTGLNNVEIKVEAKRGTDMELLLEKIYQLTTLEDRFGVNMTILNLDGLPELMGVHEVIKQWSQWRCSVVENELQMRIKELEVEINKLKGLEIIISDIDGVINTIKNSSKNKVIQQLQQKFKLNKEQAEYVSRMRLGNLNKDTLQEKISELEDKIAERNNIQKTLEEENGVNNIIIKQIKDIVTEFGKGRQTPLIEPIEKIDIKKELEKELIEDKDYYIHVTKLGYIHKLEKQKDKPMIQPNDEILKTFIMNNHDILIGLDDNREGWKIKVHELEVTQDKDLGTFFPNLFDTGKIVNYIHYTDNYKYVLYIFNDGKVAKIPLSSFAAGVNTFKNAYRHDEELFDVFMLKEDKDVKIKLNKKYITFNTSTINPVKSRQTNGVYLKRRGRVESVEVL